MSKARLRLLSGLHRRQSEHRASYQWIGVKQSFGFESIVENLQADWLAASNSERGSSKDEGRLSIAALSSALEYLA